jgi:hypothetical protein
VTIVSYSEVVKYQTCPRQYYYNHVLGLRPLEESEAITTGIKGHKLLQDFYRLMAEGKTKEEALKTTTKLAGKALDEESFMSKKSLLTAWTLVSNYIDETDFTAKAVIIENRFLLPASALDKNPALSHVQIGFTPDVVFERTGGFIDVEDSKFIQKAWTQKKLNRFVQSKLYQIFLSRMNYKISRSQIRFFNVATGKSWVKPYILGGQEETILIRDFIAGVKEVLRYKEQPQELLKFAPRTMNNNACQYCYSEYVCGLEAEGKDASGSIKHLFKKSDYDYTR